MVNCLTSLVLAYSTRLASEKNWGGHEGSYYRSMPPKHDGSCYMVTYIPWTGVSLIERAKTIVVKFRDLKTGDITWVVDEAKEK